MSDATMPREGAQQSPGATEGTNWHPDATRATATATAGRQMTKGTR